MNRVEKELARKKALTAVSIASYCLFMLAVGVCAQPPCGSPTVIHDDMADQSILCIPAPPQATIDTSASSIQAPRQIQASRSNRPSKFTDAELEMVIRMVIAEAGIEPYEGQQAVAQCIYDRVHHSNKRLYGTGVEGVLTKPHQYTRPYRGDINRYPNAIKAVHSVFIDGHRVFEETAVAFFDPRYSGKKDMEVLRRYNYLGTIGGHEFRGDIKER